LPEEPILLRIYRTDGAHTAPVESDFHRLLEAAQHSRSVARSAGREWFLTSTRFLDEIARVLKLSAEVINDSARLAPLSRPLARPACVISAAAVVRR